MKGEVKGEKLKIEDCTEELQQDLLFINRDAKCV